MAILQKLVSHGGKRLSLYADKGCHLRKMAYSSLRSPPLFYAYRHLFLNFRNFENKKAATPWHSRLTAHYIQIVAAFWYGRRDSNPQHSEPESDALSIELRALFSIASLL